MSKILVTSNWCIGSDIHDKKTSSIFYEYLNKNLFSYIKDNFSSDDLVIIMGNTLTKSEIVSSYDIIRLDTLLSNIAAICNVNIIVGNNDIIRNKTLLNVMNKKNITVISDSANIIFNNKSILLLATETFEVEGKPDYIFSFYDIECNSSKFISNSGVFSKESGKISVPPPYQIKKYDDSEVGFIVIDTETKSLKFIKNKVSPFHKKVTIKSESDIDNVISLSNDNNVISVEVDENLLSSGNIIKEKINNLIDVKVVSNVKYKKEYVSLSNLDIEYSSIINGTDNEYDEIIRTSISDILSDDEIHIFNEEMRKLKEIL